MWKGSHRENAVINSFVEIQRLTLSKEKSVVLNYGKESKCALPFPTLKVHKEDMLKEVSTKYLGKILSTLRIEETKDGAKYQP